MNESLLAHLHMKKEINLKIGAKDNMKKIEK